MSSRVSAIVNDKIKRRVLQGAVDCRPFAKGVSMSHGACFRGRSNAKRGQHHVGAQNLDGSVL